MNQPSIFLDSKHKVVTVIAILPSVQVNMRAGHLPEPETNCVRYLKIPLNALG